MHYKKRCYTYIQWTGVIYPDVITRQSNPPFSKFNLPWNEIPSVWSMFVYNTHVDPYCTSSATNRNFEISNFGFKVGGRLMVAWQTQMIKKKHQNFEFKLIFFRLGKHSRLYFVGYKVIRIKNLLILLSYEVED